LCGNVRFFEIVGGWVTELPSAGSLEIRGLT